MSTDILLDTHAFIWMIEGDETLSRKARDIISACSREGTLFISAISVWEIAMLQNKGRISLTLPLQKWIDKCISLPFIKIVDINATISIESCKLPGDFHGDPADRMIVATSRLLSTPLMTRDQKITSYAKGSYLKVVKC